jgi:hypothetical protein
MPGISAFPTRQAAGSQTPAASLPSANPRSASPDPAAQAVDSIGGVEKLRLFTKFEDFVDYFEPIVERFPVYERNVLCARIKNLMYGMYERIIRTNSSKNKLSGWYDLDLDLKILKRYITRTRKKGSKYLSKKSHETASKKLLEIGKLLGGLIKKG